MLLNLFSRINFCLKYFTVVTTVRESNSEPDLPVNASTQGNTTVTAKCSYLDKWQDSFVGYYMYNADVQWSLSLGMLVGHSQ